MPHKTHPLPPRPAHSLHPISPPLQVAGARGALWTSGAAACRRLGVWIGAVGDVHVAASV